MLFEDFELFSKFAFNNCASPLFILIYDVSQIMW